MQDSRGPVLLLGLRAAQNRWKTGNGARLYHLTDKVASAKQYFLACSRTAEITEDLLVFSKCPIVLHQKFEEDIIK